jgi:hypothetical protein
MVRGSVKMATKFLCLVFMVSAFACDDGDTALQSRSDEMTGQDARSMDGSIEHIDTQSPDITVDVALIDECALGTHACDPNADCTDTPDGFDSTLFLDHHISTDLCYLA